jgi:hypothetical protein
MPDAVYDGRPVLRAEKAVRKGRCRLAAVGSARPAVGLAGGELRMEALFG